MSVTTVALRKESVDRNTAHSLNIPCWGRSLSARRAWIEIRNTVKYYARQKTVALRKESVDRNKDTCLSSKLMYQVALRKESVDRNIVNLDAVRVPKVSLSARRAWIEILPSMHCSSRTAPSLSARRAWIEIWLCGPLSMHTRSLSARRAWIEICKP